MHLPDQGKSLVGHALGEVEFPQRLAAVQRRAGDLADHPVEFTAPAGAGDPDPTKVIVQVHRTVRQPHRVMQVPRYVDQSVAQRVQQMQPARDRPAEGLEPIGRSVLARVARRIEYRDLQRVGVQVRGLAVQQHGIHAVEPLHGQTCNHPNIMIIGNSVEFVSRRVCSTRPMSPGRRTPPRSAARRPGRCRPVARRHLRTAWPSRSPRRTICQSRNPTSSPGST